jgi:2-oxoglutarate ferredoxin oxidoreductase subunit delta
VKGKIEINREYCKSCNYCVLACPKKIIVLATDFNSSGHYPAKVINPEDCTGCCLCAEICPEVAIEVWRLD